MQLTLKHTLHEETSNRMSPVSPRPLSKTASLVTLLSLVNFGLGDAFVSEPKFFEFRGWRRGLSFSKSSSISPRSSCPSFRIPIVGADFSFALYNDILGGDNDDDDLMGGVAFDVDSARKKLQLLFTTEEEKNEKTATSSSSSSSSVSFDLQNFLEQSSLEGFPKTKDKDTSEMPLLLALDKSSLPPLPPLSTIERDVRTAEIEMLERLKEDDTPVPQLWDLWYSQRGGEALGRLRQADQLMADPTSWQDCEDSLKLLVMEYSIYFVEPLNRLATLYYLQGRMEASYHLCRLIVMHLKPWHFGALAGIVQVCLALGNRDEARYWATKRLPTAAANTGAPPFDGGPANPRRLAWVKDMVDTAKQMMKEAEKTTQLQFGTPDDYYRKQSIRDDHDKADTDAWQ